MPMLKSMDRVTPCVQKQLKLEQLRLCRSVQDDGRCGLGIVNSRIVEFPAYRIPAHQIRVVGPENVTNQVEVIDVRIEPHVVLVGGHNHRHTVVQIGDERISTRCPTAATLNYFALGTFPLIPQSGECKQLAFPNLNTITLLHCSPLLPPVSSILCTKP